MIDARLPVREARTALIAHPGAELYGSDRVMLETLAGLVERGWRVVLVVPSDGPLLAAARGLGAETRVLAVPVLRKSVLRPTALPGFVSGSAAASRRIGRLLAEVRPDVVYVSTVTIPLFLTAARLRRIPVIAHVHESERGAPMVLRAALGLPLALARRIVVNSAFSRDSLVEAVPALAGRSVVVYNGVAGPESVRPPRAALDGCLRIAYIGRLSPRKGVDLAVDALGLLVEQGVDAHLDLVGAVFTGYEWYERALREQIERLGLTDRVTFHGFRAAVWDTLAASDVAVVPSRLEEPFGNTAVEAVLAARPVVVSAIGGLAEAIDGFASAIPIPADDAGALADALAEVAAQWPAFRRRALADAPLARRRYSPDSYRDALATEIGRLAGREPALVP